MLGRYLGIAFMTLLVSLWLASGVYGFLLLVRTTDKAASVRLGTQTVHDGLAVTETDDVGRRVFPEGQIAGLIQSSWSAGVPVRAFPRGLSTESTARGERTRPAR